VAYGPGGVFSQATEGLSVHSLEGAAIAARKPEDPDMSVNLRLALALCASVFGVACSGVDGSPVEAGMPRQLPPGVTEVELDISICHPDNGPFGLDLDHPYLPFAVGNVWTYRGEEDGALVELRIEVLDEIEVVAGVTTRVVLETASEDGALHEEARNFFARAEDGSVCYFGEDVSFYEDRRVVNHEGQWRAGVDGALPGIFIPGVPVTGMSYDQEAAPGVSEDHARIVALGEPFTVPAGSFDDTLDSEETSPLDPGVFESKRYARDVGLIVSGRLLLDSR
jgi:hypothetical protein